MTCVLSGVEMLIQSHFTGYDLCDQYRLSLPVGSYRINQTAAVSTVADMRVGIAAGKAYDIGQIK